MEVVVLETEQERADLVADAVMALVQARATAVLGLATGSSPSPVYAELVRRFEAGEVSFAAASAFTLDEYLGLPPGHPEGYRQVIEREFASLVDLPADHLHTPDGQTHDVPAACAAYEKAIAAAGGVDLRCWGSAATGISPSTSPARRWRPGRVSRPSRPGPVPTTPGSSTRWTRSRTTC